jgi:hypothetical protein
MLELCAIVVVGLILFVALTKPTHAHRRRRPFVPSEWGPDRGIDPDAAAGDSVPRPPTP